MSKDSSMTLGRVLLAAIAVAACGTEPPIGEADFALSSGFKAKVKKGVLAITGDDSSSRLALRLHAGASTILDVDVGDDGSADFSFDRATFNQIVIDAGGGDDFVRMDESNGAFTRDVQVTIMGGSGNDTLIGGSGNEIFFGGPGDDTIIGGQGADVIFGGDGNDTIIWNPGDGSDVVEGEGGTDRLVFNGANAAEQIDLSADGDRLRLFRDVGTITMDVAGVENVELHARGGADSVVVHDLTGTAVARVDVDLAGVAGTATGDGLADVVTVDAPAGAGAITVAPNGGAVVVTGLAAAVAVTNGEPSLDQLVVNSDGLVNVNGSDAADTMVLFDAGGHLGASVSGFNVLVASAGTGRSRSTAWVATTRSPPRPG